MTKTEILQFLNANPLCHLATADGDQPRVRGMMMYKAEEKGILFHTGNFKDLYRQLQKNPRVELCFHSPDMSRQVRVSGTAEFLDDAKLKQEIVVARPFLKPWVEKHGLDMLVVFRVVHCRAAVWSMETNFEPTRHVEM
jgi:pyridoxamine 5'-phosphate oxidase